jgi:alpha-tubulin suppressor-like RCC1 family protein
VAVATSGALAGKRLVLVGTSPTSSCGLDDQGMLYCWGDNSYGQLGNGTTAATPLPVAVDRGGALAGRKIVWFALGEHHTCALDDAGITTCWGENTRGQLGTGDPQPRLVPTPISQLAPEFTRISVGSSTSCGWTTEGRVWCWGAGESGQLGNGAHADSSQPVALDLGDNPPRIQRVVVGGATTCAADSDGTAYCWGANESGQLGTGNTSPSITPVPVPVTAAAPANSIVRVGVGGGSACVLTNVGRAACWGADTDGMLGDG